MAQQKTLFSLLLGLPWWISALVGVAFFGITQLFFGQLSPFVAPSVALPFVVLTAVVAFRQLRTVSSGSIDDRLQALRDMSWETFGPVISAAYQRQGYEVTASNQPGFDFLLKKSGRTTLVQCRRWKVNQAGVGPLQELAAAIVKQDAYNGIAICAGDFSANAHDFARGKPIALLTGAELATLVGAVGKSDKKWFGNS